MEENSKNVNHADGMPGGELYSLFRRVWWKVLFFSLAISIVALGTTLLMQDRYEAVSVVMPISDDQKQTSALGALASFGITVGSPSKVEDLETLFKSTDLTAQVFRKYNLWPLVFQKRYDSTTGMIRPTLTDRLLGREKGPRPPGDWDAIRAGKRFLKVSLNRKSGIISIAFSSVSPEGSASVVRNYVEEAKSRLQAEALDRTGRNKKFIEEQIGKTPDPLTRDRLYTLLGQEVEREMLARNREQFGFKVIDAARAPDRKSRPDRVKTGVLGFTFSYLIGIVFFMYWGNRSRSDRRSPLV